MNKEKIQEILEAHKKWLNNEANLRGADGLDDFVSVSIVGSRNDMTLWDMKNDIVRCGCYKGSIDEFSLKVEQHHTKNPRYLAEYRAAIEFFKAVKAARQEAANVDQ